MTLNKSKYIHLAIMFILAFGISALPPFGQVTPFGMKAIGIFVSILYGWIFFDLFWTSIYGFIIMGILGVYTATAAFATGLANSMIIMVMLTMAFSVAIDMAGVTEIIANWLLQRKILTKSPWALVVGLLLIGAILGCVGAGLAAIFLLWKIVEKIAEHCEIKKGDMLLSFMIMMLTIFTFTAAFILPFKGGTLIYTTYLMQVTDIAIPAGSFILFTTINIFSIFVVMLLVAKFILRVDVSKFVLPDHVLEEIKNATPTKKQKMSLVILAAYIIILLLSSMNAMPGSKFINSQLGIGGVSAICVLILCVLNYEGKGLVQMQKVFSKIDWTVFFLLAVTYPIADLLKNPDAGIMPTLMSAIMPIVSKLGPTAFIVLAVVILGLVTQVTHNIVLAAMFMPFLLPICTEIGGNMYTLWFMLFLVLDMAYCTPAASMNAALAFGHEMLEGKHAYCSVLLLLSSRY